MAAKKSKNSPGKQPQRIRMLEGKVVKATLYDGPHGKYMAALVEDKLVVDKNGKPKQFKFTGALEWA